MSMTISRRRVAKYIAGELATTKRSDRLMTQVAAYLVENRMVNQAELLIRDIEAVLARDYGVVLAEIVSARELSKGIITKIEQFVAQQEGAKQVEVSAHVDPSLLGGVIIRTPRAEFDTTVRKQLNALKS